MPSPQMKPGDWLQIVLLAMIWGLSFFLTEICLRDLGPLSIAAGRVATAAAALLAVAVLAGHRLPVRLTDWAALAFLGLINNTLPFSLILLGTPLIARSPTSIPPPPPPRFQERQSSVDGKEV